MTEILAGLLLLLGVLSLAIRDLFHCIFLLAGFSLLCALLFYQLNAPDLAIAEAAVGGGVATFIFVYTVRKIRR